MIAGIIKTYQRLMAELEFQKREYPDSVLALYFDPDGTISISPASDMEEILRVSKDDTPEDIQNIVAVDECIPCAVYGYYNEKAAIESEDVTFLLATVAAVEVDDYGNDASITEHTISYVLSYLIRNTVEICVKGESVLAIRVLQNEV